MAGLDATVMVAVKKGRATADAWTLRIENSEVVSSHAGGDDEADVTFTVESQDVDALRSGSLPFAVGFMRGQTKVAGDTGVVLAVLPILDSAEAATARRSLLDA